MFDTLNVFHTAQMMATHAGTRHAVVARNMAHADTPGYRPADLSPFHEVAAQSAGAMRATRPGHLGGAQTRLPEPEPRADVVTDPNGNAVSLEAEMLTAVEAKRAHDRALSIYRSAMEIMRQSIGRR